MSESGRQEIDASDFFGNQKKRVALEQRRFIIRRPDQLVGPGVASQAIRVTSLNDILATYNGFFSAKSDAVSAPNDDEDFIGWVSGDAELGGVQVFIGLTSGDEFRRVFRRNPSDASYITFGSWVAV